MPKFERDIDPPFEILEPAALRGPLVFNSPHSGRTYPRSFLGASKLDALTLRRSEDSFVDELFLPVVERGFPLLRARFPRAFLDVNREPYELDPRMFEGRLPAFANTRSLRVAGGLGTIARIVGDAQEIYDAPLPVDEALRRIEALYKPYHRALRRTLANVQQNFGIVLLVDCHSMPSSSLGKDQRARADFVIGDRHGTSCASLICDTIEDVLRGLGYAVARNKPYAGGFITEHYGCPAAGMHAVQIEVNRALYMDERRIERSPGFTWIRNDLTRLAERLANLPFADLGPGRAAAE